MDKDNVNAFISFCCAYDVYRVSKVIKAQMDEANVQEQTTAIKDLNCDTVEQMSRC